MVRVVLPANGSCDWTREKSYDRSMMTIELELESEPRPIAVSGQWWRFENFSLSYQNQAGKTSQPLSLVWYCTLLSTRITVPVSRYQYHGTSITVPVSRYQYHGTSITVPVSRYQYHGTRITPPNLPTSAAMIPACDEHHTHPPLSLTILLSRPTPCQTPSNPPFPSVFCT